MESQKWKKGAFIFRRRTTPDRREDHTHSYPGYILFRKPENIYDRKKKNYNILIHISCGKSTTCYR